MEHEIYLFNKTIKLEDFDKIIKIIKDIPQIVIENICIKNVVYKNGIKERNDKKIEDSNKARVYLEEIGKATFLGFNLIINSTSKKFSLHYEEGLFRNGWKIEYSENDSAIDAFVYNIKKIFRVNPLNLYDSFRGILFFIVFLSLSFKLMIIKNIILSIICILIDAVVIFDCIIRRKMPYKNSGFIKEYKAEIVLGIIFYVLGVVSPYIIQFIQKRIS